MFSDRNRCLSPLPIGCKVVIVRREDLIVLESQNAFFFVLIGSHIKIRKILDSEYISFSIRREKINISTSIKTKSSLLCKTKPLSTIYHQNITSFEDFVLRLRCSYNMNEKCQQLFF